MINLKKLRPNNFNLNSEIKTKDSIKFVKKNHGFKKIKKCPVCFSERKESYLVQYGIKIVCCQNCNLTFSEEQPENFNDVYSNDDYLIKSINAYDKTRNYRIKRFAVERIGILKKYKKGGSLLDFGCGTGWFLEEAKKYYKVNGVEYSDSLRKWLKTKLNISSFKDISKIKNKYDIITAFDVIEHVSSPLIFLRNLRKILKKDGVILIYTPNIDSLGFSYLKEKNNLLCPPHHLFYFNKNSFEYLCKKVDMKIVETQYRGLDIGDIYAFMNRKKNFRSADFLYKNFEKLQNFIDEISYSNHVRFVIKKK